MLERLVFHDPAGARLFHAAMEWLALSGGFWLYTHLHKRSGRSSPLADKGGLWVVLCCLLGAGIGNKLVSLLQFPEL